jgi:hypothetical protein
MRLVVVGNPGGRRVTQFQTAVRAAGLPPADILSWRELLTGAPILPPSALVRVDSPGEDAEVDRLLRGPDADPYGVEGSGRWYESFVAGLRKLADLVARTPGARLLNELEDIEIMFDKRRCHAALAAAGCPVPPALSGITGFDDLRQQLADLGWERAFLKPAHGSSASGVLALSVRGARVAATTSVDISSEGLRNSLRVRTYRDSTAAALVDRLCADPVHVERWFPKASLHNRTIDLRIVVVAGKATHAVVRASRYPMTNLNLGGTRIDIADLRAVIGEASWRAWVDTCERAAAVFGRSLMVGVDLLPGLGWRRHVVGEVNAFGDLLPRLAGLPDGPAPGVDTYAAQVAAIMGASCRT